MLHLSFKDLTYLRNALLANDDDRSAYILSQVDQDLARIPKAVIPLAARYNGDIYFKTDREIEEFLLQSSHAGPKKHFLIIAENTIQAEFLFSRLVYLLKLHAYRKQPNLNLQFENGATATILPRRLSEHSTHGMACDAVIIQTNQQNPIH